MCRSIEVLPIFRHISGLLCNTLLELIFITFPTFSSTSSLISIEKEIIHKAGLGDSDAKSWLYRQYSQAMYNICIRMTGNPENARDVLQDAFLLAFIHLKQIKNPDQFAGWLRRIVINECIRFSKQLLRHRHLDHETDLAMADDAPQWWTLVDAETIHRAIKRLPDGCRQVFVLFVLEDFSHKAIARSLGISESTSKSQYQRARKLLQSMILKKMNKNG